MGFGALFVRADSERGLHHGADMSRFKDGSKGTGGRAGGDNDYVRVLADLAESERELAEAKAYAAACERTAALNQQENVALKLEQATERAAHAQTRAELESARARIAQLIHDAQPSSLAADLATAQARVEAAAALLCLQHPGHLLQALFDAGIRATVGTGPDAPPAVTLDGGDAVLSLVAWVVRHAEDAALCIEGAHAETLREMALAAKRVHYQDRARPDAPPAVTQAERAVLDAMASLHEGSLEWLSKWEPQWKRVAAAELARRAAEREGAK